MLDLTLLLTTIFSIFPVMIIGFAMRKLKLFDSSSLRSVSDVILYIAQPFLIVSSIITVEYSPANLKSGLYVVALTAGAHVLMAVIAFLTTRPFKKLDQKKVMQLGMIFSNCSFLGFPILRSVLGDRGVFWGAFYAIFFMLFFWTYGVFLIGIGRKDIRISFKKVFVNFGTVPCYIGIALFLMNLPMPAMVLNLFDSLADIGTPLSLFLTGGQMAGLPLKRLFADASVYFTAFVKLLLMPAAVLTACIFLGLSRDMTLFFTIMAALPTASNTSMLSTHYNVMPEYAAQQIGITTFLSSGTLILVIWLADRILQML
ncbi:MAG: AEC family transporter [Ruminococcaceae bacterium]|nr:AEC family transporter [Oscillospiraceae bacterium]